MSWIEEVYQSCAVRDQILQLADLDGVDVGALTWSCEVERGQFLIPPKNHMMILDAIVIVFSILQYMMLQFLNVSCGEMKETHQTTSI